MLKAGDQSDAGLVQKSAVESLFRCDDISNNEAIDKVFGLCLQHFRLFI